MTRKIAIVGGGIGGLAAAAFLHQAGLPATVYEQTGELREIGAGLVVAPNMARLLRRLGVLDPLLKTAVRLETGWEFRRWQDGTVLSAEDLATRCERLYGEHTYTAHRADLLDAINGAVPDDAVRLGKRCVQVELEADAAHPMFPFYGQGAAQAIEDAAALARYLSQDAAAERADPAAALRRYEAARIPRTSRLQEVSHARGRLNHLPDSPDQRERDQAFASTDALAANAWIYAYDPAD